MGGYDISAILGTCVPVLQTRYVVVDMQKWSDLRWIFAELAGNGALLVDGRMWYEIAGWGWKDIQSLPGKLSKAPPLSAGVPGGCAPIQDEWGKRGYMNANDLCYLPATELRNLYQTGEVSPVEVTEAVLARIDRLNPHINAYVTVTSQLARQQARIAEKAYRENEPPPALAGIPMSIKDLTRN